MYGANLFDEVDRYAAIAELIAAEESHDLVDTHEWITSEAGRRAALTDLERQGALGGRRVATGEMAVAV